MSLVSALYHIVFCTKNREMVLARSHKEELYRFIWVKIKERNCVLYRIGGIENHIHMLIGLPSSVALADLMRDLKASSSGWLKTRFGFPGFKGWASEYYASTLAYKDKDSVINYINNQESHHHGLGYDEEMSRLCSESGLEFVDLF